MLSTCSDKINSTSDWKDYTRDHYSPDLYKEYSQATKEAQESGGTVQACNSALDQTAINQKSKHHRPKPIFHALSLSYFLPQFPPVGCDAADSDVSDQEDEDIVVSYDSKYRDLVKSSASGSNTERQTESIDRTKLQDELIAEYTRPVSLGANKTIPSTLLASDLVLIRSNANEACDKKQRKETDKKSTKDLEEDRHKYHVGFQLVSPANATSVDVVSSESKSASLLPRVLYQGRREGEPRRRAEKPETRIVSALVGGNESCTSSMGGSKTRLKECIQKQNENTLLQNEGTHVGQGNVGGIIYLRLGYSSLKCLERGGIGGVSVVFRKELLDFGVLEGLQV